MGHQDKKLDALPRVHVLLHRDGEGSGRTAVDIVTMAIRTINKIDKSTFEAADDIRRQGYTVLKTCHRETAELYAEQLQSQNLVVTLSELDKLSGGLDGRR